MKDHLAQNVTFLVEIWKMTARDGTVVAYACHTRSLVFGGVTYAAGPFSLATTTRKMGLEPDSVTLTGALGEGVTEADIAGGKWKGARVVKETVNYLDLTMGSVAKFVGVAGKFTVRNGIFTVEAKSLSSLLQQEIGEMTSPVDRSRTLAETGVTVATFTHGTSVASFTDRRVFKVSYVQPSANYFRYGKATFTSGANSGLEMEIEDSETTDSGTRTQITLQLPMRSAIAVGDAVSLIRGYAGTRDDAKALGSPAMLNFQGEPDLPMPDDTLRYQP